uniref:Major facilitator superfamily (MFS) profile domain-containing protein n=1 Tax=Panagrolaimus sp. ES5 TaxID=591445 RepID=A0AC34GTZ5_9BILA
MLCFIALAVSTSNLSVSMVCMIKKESDIPENIVNDLIRIRRSTNNSMIEEFLDQELGAIVNLTILNNNFNSNNNNNSGNNNNNETTATLTKCQLARLRKRAIEFESNPQLLEALNERLENEAAAAKNSNNGGDGLKVEVKTCHAGASLVEWSGTEQGIVFAAQNAGSLLMLVTGTFADRLNSKWCIVLSLCLLIISNAVIPSISQVSVWLVIMARVLTGFSDALLQPSTNSMITRWFPPKERTFAIGLITGGRQIGTLLILPTAGFLCEKKQFMGGWPSIFYISAFIVAIILIFWVILSADKPAKHFCVSKKEQLFIQEKIQEENLGKRKERKSVPWKSIATCVPLYAGVAALICHEYPLVIMLQLLPKYMDDVLKISVQMNGIISALPIIVLFVSKTLSSSLASVIGSRKRGRFLLSRTVIVKIFNGIASLGLGICIGIVPLMNGQGHSAGAISLLCLANVFAGMHTPGVQTALLQLAPAYSGIITGIAFGFVAIFSILNKVISNVIVKDGSLSEWTLVFEISAVVAVLPVFFFTIWGSADRQPWASQKHAAKTISTVTTENETSKKPHFTVGGESTLNNSADDYSLAQGIRFTMFLNEVDDLNDVDYAEDTSGSGSLNSNETETTSVEEGKY